MKDGGMEDRRNMSRRTLLAGSAALAAKAALSPTEAQAGIVDDFIDAFQGVESRSELNKPNYETEKYMNENGGELRRNMDRLTLEVGDNMRAGKYNIYKTEVDRKAAQDRDGSLVYEQRAEILGRLDPQLIPKMIVAYVQKDLTNKPLVILYQKLGGDITDIQKLADKGVDKSITERIMSHLEYDLGAPTKDYGIAKYKLITFKEKPQEKKITDKLK